MGSAAVEALSAYRRTGALLVATAAGATAAAVPVTCCFELAAGALRVRLAASPLRR